MRLLNKSVVLALLAGTAVAAAQEQDPVFRTDTRLVVLHATVANRKGQLITDLPQNAFKVFENNVEQSIKLFRREDVPVSLGLIIDSSGSMRDKRSKVNAAALAAIKASNPQDEVFIVNYNDDAYLDVPMTSDLKVLEEGLSRIDSRGGTAMRDALSMSIDYLKKKAKRDKKVLLVITDGNDNTSTETLEKLVQRAHDSEVLVFAIGILSEEEPREAKKAQRALNAITTATGGLAHYPKAVEDVGATALLVAQEIRNQYVIAYTPAIQALDGTFRTIKVTANGPGNPVVRTRSGYYATEKGAQNTAQSQK
ncbi:MAG: VWA domain-containing protein [Bryobacteraceae bacterium]|nr:VWA domain-containing protein [Bryobacteraceae bacterium]